MTDFTSSNIYSFPGDMQGDYWWQHRHCHKPHLKRTQVIETSKETLINDATGFTRYIVSLVSRILEDGIRGFQVQVQQFYPSQTVGNTVGNDEGNTEEDEEDIDNPMLVIPSIDEYEKDYDKIMHQFNVCVERYNSLVVAETKDFNDIDIYAKNIGYENTQPECCAFCKWSRKCRLNAHYGCKDMPMLECHCPDNQAKFQYMVDDPHFKMPHAHRYCNDGWQKLPWMHDNPLDKHCNHDSLDPIFPRVGIFGKCKNFEKQKPL